MAYYNRLKDLREDAGLNQSEVGEIIGTTGNYYGDYEKGKRDIPTERMIMLARHYKVSMDYITGLTNDKGGLHKNNKEERTLLNLFNKLSIEDKNRIIGRMEEITERKDKGNISINQTVNIK